jgi:WD40 repeat protein
MDPQTLAPLHLLWNALAVLGILSGLVLALAGYRLFEQVAQLPGLVLGALIAGGIAYLLWHGPLPTIAAGAVGGWAGAAVIRAYRPAIIFAAGAWVGLLVALVIAAVLALLMQQMPAPAALLLLFVTTPVLGGLIAVPYERLMITLATAFSGAGLFVGGLARLSVSASGGGFDANLIAAMLFGSLVVGVAGVIVQYRVPGASEGRPEALGVSKQKQGVFRNPAPRHWDRAYPDVLPNALRMRTSTSGRAFNSHWVSAMGMAPDGSHLFVGSAEGAIFVVDAENGSLVSLHTVPVSHKQPFINSIGAPCDAEWIAVAAEGDVFLLTPRQNKFVRIPLSGSFKPSGLAVSRDGRWLSSTLLASDFSCAQVSAGGGGMPIVDVAHTGQRGASPSRPDKLDGGMTGVAFHPTGHWLAVLMHESYEPWFSWFSDDPGSKGALSKLYFYDPNADEWFSPDWFTKRSHLDDEARIPNHILELEGWPIQLASTDDGARMALLCTEFVAIFQAKQVGTSFRGGRILKLKELQRIRADVPSGFSRLALSGDGRLLAVSFKEEDKAGHESRARIKIWDARSGSLLCELTSYDNKARVGDLDPEIDGLVFHPNGRWLFSGGSSGVIRRWVLNGVDDQRRACDMAMQALPDDNWVVWRDPDGPNRCWVNPSPEAQRWLGWRMPSGGEFAEYRPFDAYN